MSCRRGILNLLSSYHYRGWHDSIFGAGSQSGLGGSSVVASDVVVAGLTVTPGQAAVVGGDGLADDIITSGLDSMFGGLTRGLGQAIVVPHCFDVLYYGAAGECDHISCSSSYLFDSATVVTVGEASADVGFGGSKSYLSSCDVIWSDSAAVPLC